MKKLIFFCFALVAAYPLYVMGISNPSEGGGGGGGIAGPTLSGNFLPIFDSGAGEFIDSPLRLVGTDLISSNHLNVPPRSISIGNATLSDSLGVVAITDEVSGIKSIVVANAVSQALALPPKAGIPYLLEAEVTVTPQASDVQTSAGITTTDWFQTFVGNKALNDVIIRGASATTGMRLTVRQTTAGGAILYENVDSIREAKGEGFTLAAAGDTSVSLDSPIAVKDNGRLHFTISSTNTFNLKGNTIVFDGEASEFVPFYQLTKQEGGVRFAVHGGGFDVASTGTVTVAAFGTAITGVGTAFLTEFALNDIVSIQNEFRQINSITDNLNMTVSVPHLAGAAGVQVFKEAQILELTNLLGEVKMSMLPDGDTTFVGGLTTDFAIMPEVSTVPGGTPIAGTGTLWVKDTVPNELVFTNDGGTDFDISAGVLAGTTDGVAPLNTALGVGACDSVTTTASNVCIGFDAMTAFTSGGGNNVAIGDRALASSISATNAVAIGTLAMFTTTSGSNNVAIGRNSLITSAGLDNVAVGAFSGDTLTTGANNTMIGSSADVNSSSAANRIAIGQGAIATINSGLFFSSGGAELAEVTTASELVTYDDATGQMGPNTAFTVDASDNVVLGSDLAVNGGDLTSSGSFTITPGAGTNLEVTTSGAGDFVINESDFVVTASTSSLSTAGDLAVNGGDITSTAATLNIDSGSTIVMKDNTTVEGAFSLPSSSTFLATLGNGAGDTFRFFEVPGSLTGPVMRFTTNSSVAFAPEVLRLESTNALSAGLSMIHLQGPLNATMGSVNINAGITGININSADAMILGTNGSTAALTLDTAQNATFASNLTSDALIMPEAATVPGGAPGATFGEIWVKNDSPSALFFTNDAGTDIEISTTLQGFTDPAAPNNTGLGGNACDSLGAGAGNTCIGHNAGTAISTGGGNVAVGFQALLSLTTGNDNFGMGTNAAVFLTGGTNVIAMGRNALLNVQGNDNIGFGSSSGSTLTTGSNNIIIGTSANVDAAGSSRRIVIGDSASGSVDRGLFFPNGANELDNVSSAAAEIVLYDDATGQMGPNIGLTVTSSVLTAAGFTGESAGATPINLTSASATAATAGVVNFQRSRGSIAAPSLIIAPDELGTINFRGHDGSDFELGAQIRAITDSPVGLNDMPARLAFYTTPDGGVAPVEHMRITDEGRIGIGGINPTAGSMLHVADDVNGTAALMIFQNTSVAQAADLSESVEMSFGFAETPFAGFIRMGKEEDYTSIPNRSSFMSFHNQINGGGFERIRIAANGDVGIGTASPGRRLEVIDDMAISEYGTANFPSFRTSHARGTEAAPTTVVDGDGLAIWAFDGYDGTSFINGAVISAAASGAVSTGVLPTDLVFSTNAGGGASTEVLRVFGNGTVRSKGDIRIDDGGDAATIGIDQGVPSIELTGTGGSDQPFIDFSNNGEDNDARIQLISDNVLTISGTNLRIDGAFGFQLPVQNSTAPVEPVVCNAANVGYMQYVDDTNDSGGSTVCVCLSTADNGAGTPTTFDWLRVDDNAVACTY